MPLSSSQQAALERLAQRYNISAGSQLTPTEYADLLLSNILDEEVRATEARLLELMKPVGAEIAAAAGGDPVKIAAALEAGKAAALATL